MFDFLYTQLTQTKMEHPLLHDALARLELMRNDLLISYNLFFQDHSSMKRETILRFMKHRNLRPSTVVKIYGVMRFFEDFEPDIHLFNGLNDSELFALCLVSPWRDAILTTLEIGGGQLHPSEITLWLPAWDDWVPDHIEGNNSEITLCRGKLRMTISLLVGRKLFWTIAIARRSRINAPALTWTLLFQDFLYF